MKLSKNWMWLAGALLVAGCANPTTDSETESTKNEDGKSDQIGDAETCAFDIRWEVDGIDTTSDLEPFITAQTEYNSGDVGELPTIDRQQIFDALLQDGNVIDSVEGAFEIVDEGLIDVIEITLEDGTDLDYVRWFGGDNEVGVIYLADTLVAQAVVSDGDFKGCEGEAPDSLIVECSFGSWLRESSEELDPIPGSEVLITIEDDATTLQLNQIRMAAIQTQQIIGDESAEELFGAVDQGEFILSAVEVDGAVYDWVQYFAGDTEVGALFEVETTIVVAEIGDGDISGCEKPDDTIDPEPTKEFECTFHAWLFDTSGDLSDAIEDVPVEVINEENIGEQTLLTQQMIYQAAVHLEMLDSDAEFNAIWDATQDDEYLVRTFQIDGSEFMTWIKFFAGDTEIGVIFDMGDGSIIAEISDGTILPCSPAVAE